MGSRLKHMPPEVPSAHMSSLALQLHFLLGLPGSAVTCRNARHCTTAGSYRHCPTDCTTTSGSCNCPASIVQLCLHSTHPDTPDVFLKRTGMKLPVPACNLTPGTGMRVCPQRRTFTLISLCMQHNDVDGGRTINSTRVASAQLCRMRSWRGMYICLAMALMGALCNAVGSQSAPVNTNGADAGTSLACLTHTQHHLASKYKTAQQALQVLMSAVNNTIISYAVNWADLADGGEQSEDGSETVSNLAQLGSSTKRATETPSIDAQGTASSQLQQTLACMNSVYTPEAVTWQRATSRQGTVLKVVAAWVDERRPNSALTIVTSGSLDRISQVRAQCQSWRGPLSVVLFQGLVQSDYTGQLNEANKAALRKAVLQVATLVSELQASTARICRLSIMLTYEVYADEDTSVLFPVNILRNYARLQARTQLVSTLDADLLPSRSLWDRVANGTLVSQMMLEANKNKTVFIIPTFELKYSYSTAAWAETLVSAPDKDIVVLGLNKNIVMPFYWTRFPTGHNLTNFNHWREAHEDYEVQYQDRCEPYLIGDRNRLPWFDVRYRGFGENKVQNVHNVYAEGFKFKVLHDAYTIHRPHRHGKALRVYVQNLGSKGRLGIKTYVGKLLKAQKAQFQAGRPWHAVVGAAIRNCGKQLDWWKDSRQVFRQSSLPLPYDDHVEDV